METWCWKYNILSDYMANELAALNTDVTTEILFIFKPNCL